MFGIATFDPWIASEYKRATLKPLVLGESPYDEDFTDRQIIESQIERDLPGGQRRTFTNFERAVLGQEHSEGERKSFWRRSIFYNYNLSFFPGGPREPVEYGKRENAENGIILQRMLTRFRPIHTIVWGKANWESIDIGPVWKDSIIPGSAEPYSAAKVKGHTTLFTRVHHPSSGFSSRYWRPILKAFLALKPYN